MLRRTIVCDGYIILMFLFLRASDNHLGEKQNNLSFSEITRFRLSRRKHGLAMIILRFNGSLQHDTPLLVY